MADFFIEPWQVTEELADEVGWWALSHNFDVVATILAMAELSWQKGFDAGRVIAEFSEIDALPDGATVGAILFGQDSGN